MKSIDGDNLISPLKSVLDTHNLTKKVFGIVVDGDTNLQKFNDAIKIIPDVFGAHDIFGIIGVELFEGTCLSHKL